jgi:hypothetical protein
VVALRGRTASYVLGPVPGVGVMAKGSQGLLNVGTLSRGLLAVSGVICGSSAGEGGVFFARLQGGALGGSGPVWVQLGPPHPPRVGAVPDNPVQNKMTRIALAGRSKIGCWIGRSAALRGVLIEPSPCRQTCVLRAILPKR